MNNHRQTINAAALEIARVSGWDIDPDHDFVAAAERNVNSLKLQEFKTHARSGDFLKMAEAAFAVITGDRPDYDGDEPNDSALAQPERNQTPTP
jgi:hypothetical protein